MSEETMAILRMVSEKKITADEGATLLEAITSGDSEEEHFNGPQPGADRKRIRHGQRAEQRSEARRTRQASREERHRAREHERRERGRSRAERQAHWQDKLDHLSEMFDGVFGKNGIFGTTGGFGTSRQGGPWHGSGIDEEESNAALSFSVLKGTGLHVTSEDGNVLIRGTDGDELRVVAPNGMTSDSSKLEATYDQERNQLVVKARDQSVVLEVPWLIDRAEVLLRDGNIRVTDISASISTTLRDGNLSARDITGDFHAVARDANIMIKDLTSSDVNIALKDGSANVGMTPLNAGDVKLECVDGVIALNLPETSAFGLTANLESGRFTTNITDETFDLNGPIELSHNGGGADMVVKAHTGAIDVRLVDAPDTEVLEESDSEEAYHE